MQSQTEELGQAGNDVLSGILSFAALDPIAQMKERVPTDPSEQAGSFTAVPCLPSWEQNTLSL